MLTRATEDGNQHEGRQTMVVNRPHVVSSLGHGAGRQRRQRLGEAELRLVAEERSGDTRQPASGLACNSEHEGFQSRHPTVCLFRVAGLGKRPKNHSKAKGEGREEPLAFCMPGTPHLWVSAGCWSVAFTHRARSLLAAACQGRLQLTVVRFLHPRGSKGVHGAGRWRQLLAVLLFRCHISG